MATGNTATVLVVDDEPLVLMHAMDMIEEAGWTALEAASSAEALKVLAANPAVDVLFTDINMPGEMDGLALAARVHQLRPHVELVITSGRQMMANSKLPDSGTFLAKPYGYDDLVGTIDTKLTSATRA